MLSDRGKPTNKQTHLCLTDRGIAFSSVYGFYDGQFSCVCFLFCFQKTKLFLLDFCFVFKKLLTVFAMTQASNISRATDLILLPFA